MTEAAASQSVRAFVSYSWSSPTHESWVIGLASRLREDGVDVILDKWDLKPGHDAYQFMESMVTDKSVTKVMMICDKTYVEKANHRSGGVGAESQIISPEIYGKGSQDKFAALITDEDEDGNAHVPIFYKGRIFFDFRRGDKFEYAYEQLLRWIIDRPQYVKPKLGSVPESILEATPVASGTQSRARRAEEAIRQGSRSANGLLREYGDALVAEVKSLTPVEVAEQPFDEAVVQSITSIRPYLRQLSEVVATALRFAPEPEAWERVLEIHEQLGRLMWRSPDMMHWNSQQFDPFKVAAHDAFLATIALALEERRFDLAEMALRRPYLVNEERGTDGRITSDFTVFRQYVDSLDHRNSRLGLRRLSLEADLLKDAYPDTAVPNFESMMQADFVLYLRFHSVTAPSSNWYPHSLVYASRRYIPFPLFARAESLDFFNQLRGVLGVADLADFKAKAAEIINGERAHRLFDYHGVPIGRLANLQNLGTLP
ncbi:toll/interleukin-1 receptor domain-containing protein [uncultured Brevundimonas sp.]|uniref:toll/interleukin-1 receptor domain-containing protein n=1 Tax=uncultured Brevundimonas sp. TaxID=213418 RepID=UPI002638D4E0|nr:TIR domain-containing protein [uncultured Brevundimonas sp.]